MGGAYGDMGTAARGRRERGRGRPIGGCPFPLRFGDFALSHSSVCLLMVFGVVLRIAFLFFSRRGEAGVPSLVGRKGTGSKGAGSKGTGSTLTGITVQPPTSHTNQANILYIYIHLFYFLWVGTYMHLFP